MKNKFLTVLYLLLSLQLGCEKTDIIDISIFTNNISEKKAPYSHSSTENSAIFNSVKSTPHPSKIFVNLDNLYFGIDDQVFDLNHCNSHKALVCLYGQFPIIINKNFGDAKANIGQRYIYEISHKNDTSAPLKGNVCSVDKFTTQIKIYNISEDSALIEKYAILEYDYEKLFGITRFRIVLNSGGQLDYLHNPRSQMLFSDLGCNSNIP